DGGTVIGDHDGYRYLGDPVTHRRTVTLDGRSRRLFIRDEIHAGRVHQIAMWFHVAESCKIQPVGPHRFAISNDERTVVLALDSRFETKTWHGSTEPITGWVSRGYHRKSPATAIQA